jgi:hypothetical protein
MVNYNHVILERQEPNRPGHKEDGMDDTQNKVLVRTLLEHAQDYPWMMQDIGLLGLRLDNHRKYRLHVWDPAYSESQPPIHDHPYDFTSTIVVGEITNTRYDESDSGVEFVRISYSPPDEESRRTDAVRLSGVSSTFTEGDRYSQLAHELHDSQQIPGTVTILRCAFKEVSELTVCLRFESEWVSGHSRLATSDEVKRITHRALELF